MPNKRHAKESLPLDCTLKNRKLVYNGRLSTIWGALQTKRHTKNALRAIFDKKKEFGNEPLRLLAKELKLEDRLRNLKKRYLSKCLESKNPILVNLISEYNAYANGRTLEVKTPLCGVLTSSGT